MGARPARIRLSRRGGRVLLSVPYELIRQQVETRVTERTVEVFHRGQRRAHARRYGGPPHRTLPDHMPSAHRLYAEWNPERFQSQARAIGPNTEALIIAVLARRPHPEQGCRPASASCVSIAASMRSGPRLSRPEPWRSRAQLPERRLHHRAQARWQDGAAHRGRRTDPTHQHPRFPLLPLRRTTLLEHPTIDRLRELGLEGMAKSLRELSANAESKALGNMEWLGILLEHEMTLRQQKRFEARARTAKLRHLASVEDIDYRAARGLDRALFLKLAGCDWIREHRHCLMTGPCEAAT